MRKYFYTLEYRWSKGEPIRKFKAQTYYPSKDEAYEGLGKNVEVIFRLSPEAQILKATVNYIYVD